MGTKLIRKFGGKRYQYLYYKTSKAEAEAAAKSERAKGWNIRIVRNVIQGRLYYSLYGAHSGKRP